MGFTESSRRGGERLLVSEASSTPPRVNTDVWGEGVPMTAGGTAEDHRLGLPPQAVLWFHREVLQAGSPRELLRSW